MKPVFVFDLDSTITKCELLPLIAEGAGLGGEMARLTERAMQGGAPFEQDFPRRVALLGDVSVARARAIVRDAPLNGAIVDFLRENAPRCRIVTGNLDVWIAPLVKALGMEGRCFCSRAQVQGGRVIGVRTLLDKGAACKDLPRPFVAIGDGSNDVPMLRAADIGIAFGGVRRPSEALAAAADMVVYDEGELAAILRRLL